MEKLTASIGGRQAYVYRCLETDESGAKLHPECGDGWHIIDPAVLDKMAADGDPEYYFVASHIPEVWDAEWDRDNSEIHPGKGNQE